MVWHHITRLLRADLSEIKAASLGVSIRSLGFAGCAGCWGGLPPLEYEQNPYISCLRIATMSENWMKLYEILLFGWVDKIVEIKWKKEHLNAVSLLETSWISSHLFVKLEKMPKQNPALSHPSSHKQHDWHCQAMDGGQQVRTCDDEGVLSR